MPDELRILPAAYEDLPEIARIHVAAWKQTYIGQVPQAFLDSLDVAVRLRGWQEQFANLKISGLLIARMNHTAAGFVCFGRGRDPDRRDWGEIYAIYVLESYWGSGVGYSLYKDACVQLKNDGFARAYLWVLDTNQRAIAAYRRWGGMVQPDRLKDHVIGGQPVKEVSIVFCL
ncbi:MAG: GNAT family N-acetyltransferase [Acidobacteriaceae bacterium]|nr:GNAT family N-acetyltransferase [Acidobacteriaceae bacterium]